MRKPCSRAILSGIISCLLVAAIAALAVTPASAQNRKRSWEIFIYFGQYAGQEVPSAIQQAVVRTYRLDPLRAIADPNSVLPPGEVPRFCEICKNAGLTGDPNGAGQTILFPPSSDPQTPSRADVCPKDSSGNRIGFALDPTSRFLDECDDDVEAVYKYNTNGIVTNGAVQNRDREFLLGARLGYNVTRHWEAELDIGFAKQRLDMTKNLIPMLREPVSNPADPFFNQLADFYEFTWANYDYFDLGYVPTFSSSDPNIILAMSGIGEIPNVPQHRFSKNPNADIPAMLPSPLVSAETFADVTEFINRIFLNPAAIRNRANKINIDIFSAGLSGVYNFNTKPDSRIVPYASAGAGIWHRQFDSPYKGEDTNYYTYGGGVRFFVNEIFSFRFEGRFVQWADDTSTITAEIPRQNLLDFTSAGTGACLRDQDPPAQQPPAECTAAYLASFNSGASQHPRLPKGANPGGFANIKIVTELDDFYEIRLGFDVLLAGR